MYWGDFLFKITPRHPRFINHFLANFHGYFWLPCGMCGRKFAGYEASKVLGIPEATPGFYEMVCWRCGDKVKEKYHEHYSKRPWAT